MPNTVSFRSWERKKIYFRQHKRQESWQPLKSDFQHLISENGLIWCIPRMVAIQQIPPVAIKTHERGWKRVRGKSFEPRGGLMEEEEKRTSCSFSNGKLGTLFHPTPRLTPPLLLLWNYHSRWAQLCLKDTSPSARVRGLAVHHVNGTPLLLNISHLIWKVLNRGFN